MKRWMAWMVMVGMVALFSACDSGGDGNEEQSGALEQGADVFEDDVYEGAEAEPGVEPRVCVPQCGGAECGPDGCGGTCGSCSSGDVCDAGECVSECGVCMETECAYEASACNSNWECPSLMQCLSGCGSDSCMESCIYSYYGGADDLIDLLECVDAECSWEC
ncbi:MAG: hypothetical protein ABIK09_02095 [Pseudomonadota bacterium]